MIQPPIENVIDTKQGLNHPGEKYRRKAINTNRHPVRRTDLLTDTVITDHVTHDTNRNLRQSTFFQYFFPFASYFVSDRPTRGGRY